MNSVVADGPATFASRDGGSISLGMAGQESVVVKDTPTPHVARIVVSGHSRSVSQLGPPSEEQARDALSRLRARFAAACGGG